MNCKVIVIFLILLDICLECVHSTGGFPKGFLNDITESDAVRARLSSRWKWEVWDVVPGTHIYNIYVFNVTNPKEVEEHKAKPNFVQLGPYAYVEHRIKFNVSVNLDLTVNYERNFTYTFVPKLSNGTENDLVNSINVPLIIFATWMADKGSAGNSAINSLVQAGETLVKQNVRVGDLIFDGMDLKNYEQYLKLVNPSMADEKIYDEFKNGKYGILKLKRGANEEPFRVQSGLKDSSNIGKIVTWNDNPSLPWWSGSTCNQINGTDGTVLRPFVEKDSQFQIYDVDLCRSVSFDYEGNTLFQDLVPEYVFHLNKNTLEDPRKYSVNQCFCKNPGPEDRNCLKSGMLDVSACHGVPFVMSYPHFYQSSQEYLDAVEGMKPNAKLHRTLIEAEPRLGVVVQYFRRFQWNIWLQPIQTLDYFRNIKPIIFPVLWNNDHFTLDDDKAELMVAEIANQSGGYYGTGIKLEGFVGFAVVITFFSMLFQF